MSRFDQSGMLRDAALGTQLIEREGSMERRISVGLSAVAMWGLALLPSDAIGQQKSVSEQLLGTWSLVSFERTAT